MRKVTVTLIAAVTAAVLSLPAGAGAAGPPCTSSYGSAGAAGTTFPNDPLFSRQWGLAQIRAPQAWARGGSGAGATIAIVDSGVDLGHPDLSAKLVAGADFAGDQPCAAGQDREGHGTHVAGIAAASTGNAIGGAGTAPGATLIPVRVLDSTGSGTSDNVGAGIRWAADHGAHVINLSLGDGISIGGIFDVPVPVDVSGVAEAVDYAWGKGAVVVAAAGNSSFPFCNYPGASVHAVCVAATDRSSFPSSFSNFPVSPEGGVAVRAPGGDGSGCGDDDIWSSYWPGAADDTCGVKGYEPLAGTSMSTPFVSGLAAILRGGGLSNQQVVDCLAATSSNGGRYDPVNGYGIVNAEAAVAGCTTLKPGGLGGSNPTTPTGQSTTPPGGQPPSQGGVAGEKARSDTTAPRIRLALAKKKARVARAGYVTVMVRVSEASRVALRITSGRQTAAGGRNAVVLARAAATIRPGAARAVKVKLTKTGRRVMRARRSMTVTVLGVARDHAGNDGTAIAEGRIRR